MASFYMGIYTRIRVCDICIYTHITIWEWIYNKRKLLFYTLKYYANKFHFGDHFWRAENFLKVSTVIKAQPKKSINFIKNHSCYVNAMNIRFSYFIIVHSFIIACQLKYKMKIWSNLTTNGLRNLNMLENSKFCNRLWFHFIQDSNVQCNYQPLTLVSVCDESSYNP